MPVVVIVGVHRGLEQGVVIEHGPDVRPRARGVGGPRLEPLDALLGLPPRLGEPQAHGAAHSEVALQGADALHSVLPSPRHASKLSDDVSPRPRGDVGGVGVEGELPLEGLGAGRRVLLVVVLLGDHRQPRPRHLAREVVDVGGSAPDAVLGLRPVGSHDHTRVPAILRHERRLRSEVAQLPKGGSRPGDRPVEGHANLRPRGNNAVAPRHVVLPRRRAVVLRQRGPIGDLHEVPLRRPLPRETRDVLLGQRLRGCADLVHQHMVPGINFAKVRAVSSVPCKGSPLSRSGRDALRVVAVALVDLRRGPPEEAAARASRRGGRGCQGRGSWFSPCLRVPLDIDAGEEGASPLPAAAAGAARAALQRLVPRALVEVPGGGAGVDGAKLELVPAWVGPLLLPPAQGTLAA
mmetsp:Transcript_25547/g.64359  ORF Transcript_25547/g.64359 Transcript_25547/m.64359 type:complete len:407 (+) Transcript_25547:133-1353(+)